MIVLLLVIGFAACWWLGQHVRQQLPPIGQFLTVNGVRLHYIDSRVDSNLDSGFETHTGSTGPDSTGSDKPVLVMFHGATGNLRDFHSSIYAPLSAQYRVVLLDRPGLGYSERPQNGQWMDPHQQAELMRAAIQQLGIEKPVLLGHSWSGTLVLDYLLNHQDEVTAAILLSPVSHAWPGGVTWYNYIQAVPVLREVMAYSVLPLLGWLGADSGAKGIFEPGQVPANYRTDIGLDLFFQPKAMLNNFQDLRLLCEFVTRMSIRYPEITVPVQIISGTDDTVVYSWNHSKRLARELKHATWLDLPDTGHAPHHAHTEKVLAVINEFLSPQ